MKAVVLEDAAPTLTYKDVPDPVPDAGEAVIELRAAALNHRDLWITKGKYPGIRFPSILGSDGAGVLSSLGGDGTPLQAGDEVIINPSLNWGPREKVQGADFSILGLPHDGTFAQMVKVPVRNVAPKPAHLTFREAAALPLAGLTAFRALFVRAKMQAHDRVLITGIGGGVAGLGLQFAVACGAKVFVTTGSESKLEAAQEAGALGGALYHQEGWEDTLRDLSDGFDVILDSAGGPGFNSLIGLANPGARLVFPGATLGNPAELDWRATFWKQLTIVGSTMGSAIDFNAMVHYVATHEIKPLVDSVHPLAEARAALDLMDSGEQNGKIVLDCEV